MDVIAKATEHVYHGQVPVLTVDQPLFAIAKTIPWSWPDVYGDSKYVGLMGVIHIEIALLNVLGHWWDGSGWLSLLTTANVTLCSDKNHEQILSTIDRDIS